MLREEIDDGRYWLGVESALPGTRFDSQEGDIDDEMERRLRLHARKLDVPPPACAVQGLSTWSRVLQLLRLNRA